MTRTFAVVSFGVALVVVGLSAAPAAAAAQPDTAPPTLVGIEFTPDAVAMSGLALVPVTVNLHFTDESGVAATRSSVEGNTPFILLSRVSGGPMLQDLAEVHLGSGTAQDGVWSATIQVPSTWDGQWQVTSVVASDNEGNKLVVDPRTLSIDTVLDVTGTHQPALTIGFRPDPVLGDAPLTVFGRAFFLDTGEGIPNLDLFIAFDNECIEFTPRPNAKTNARGEYSITSRSNLFHCVGILRPSNVENTPAFLAVRTGAPRVKLVVNAAADRRSVQVGSKVTIRGTAAGFAGNTSTAQLQRLERGVWRTIDTARVETAQPTFALVDIPRPAGTYRYRVKVPHPDDDSLSGLSRTIVVQVTDGGGLPVTGPSIGPLVLVALALIAVGGVLILIVRRRRTPRADTGDIP